MAIFTGGLLQFIAGMWEFPRGNVFGATGKLKDVKLYIFLSLLSYFLKKKNGIQEQYFHSNFKHLTKKKIYCFLTFS